MHTTAQRRDESSSLLENGNNGSSIDKKKHGGLLRDKIVPWVKQCVGILIGVVLGILLARIMDGSERDGNRSRVRGHTAGLFHGESSLSSDVNTSDWVFPTSTNSKYTSFQALNFQLYTGGALLYLPDGTLNPECHVTPEGTVDDVAQCYTAHDNITEDVHDRLAIMEAALDRAYQASSKDPTTLKVFVAPEFFFRGKNGAYVVDEDRDQSVFDEVNGTCGSEICHILEGLEDMVANKKFEDWVFLFGTLIVSEALPQEDAYDYLFYNFGMLYKGYDPETTTHRGKRFLVPKRYVSTSDFLTPTRRATNKTQEIFETAREENEKSRAQEEDALVFPHSKKYDRGLWHKYKNELTKWDYIMIEYGWLQIDGITLTVEICLDHDLRSALTAYLVDSVLPAPTLIPSTKDGKVSYVEMPRHQAQLSIVSSAGMTVSETSMALAHTGSIILQDGLSSDLPAMSWVYECFRYEWQFQGGAEVIQRNATLTTTEVVFHYHVLDRYQKVSVFPHNNWKTKLRGVFSNSQYEPMITAFSPMPIAKIF